MKNISITIDEITEDIHLELIPVGLPGPQGLSAFEVWQKKNPGGTMEEYHQFLKGEPFRFEDFTPEQIKALKIKGDPFTYADFTPEQLEGLKVKGDDGRTAYEIAVANGYPGTEYQWLTSLKGDPFRFEDFTEDEKESLKIKGDEGLSAYEVAVRDGFIGTESEWLISLKGETGDMPIDALNSFLLNYFDEPIVYLNSRAQSINQKLRFVQKELDELEITPNLLTNMAATSPGKLHSVIPSDGSGDWTVERNSIATYVDKDGNIKTAAPNVPRIDWSSGEPALLVEGEATNYIPNNVNPISGESSGGFLYPFDLDFENLGEAVIKLSEPRSPIWRRISNYSTLKPNTDYTFSYWARVDSGSKTHGMYMHNGDFHDKKITITTDWQRFEHTLKSGPSGELFVYLFDSRSSFTNYSPFYIKLPQVEEGRKATSAIITNGSVTTRLIDEIYTNSGQALFGQTEGTVFIEIELSKYDNISSHGIFYAGTGSTEYRLQLERASTGAKDIALVYTKDGVGTVIRTNSTVKGGRYKIAAQYGDGKVKLVINGELIASADIDPQTTNFNKIVLGRTASQNRQLNDSIKSLSLHKTALTDDQLIALTTI